MINSATHAWWITYVILILLLAPSHLCAVVETVKWDLNTMEPDLLENRTFHFVVAHVLRFHRRPHAERALHEIKTVGTQLHVLESELHMTQWRGVLSRDTKGGLAEMILGLTNWHLPVLAWLGPYCSDHACYLAMAEARFRNHELSDAWHDVNAYSIQQLGYRHIGDLLRLKEAKENISEFVSRTHAIDIWEDSNIRKQKLRALLRDNELVHRRLNNPHDYM